MPLANVPHVRLSRSEIAFIARHLGIVGANLPITVAIAWAESQGWTNSYRPVAENPLGGQDNGLLQVNSASWPGHDQLTLLDPFVALLAGKEIVAGPSGWGPWNYGPNAYGPKIKPPGVKRPARTDASIDLAGAAAACNVIENPYWRMVDAGMAVYDLPVPAKGFYVSRLPAVALKYGNGGDATILLRPFIAQLQQILVEMGLWIGSTDQYYGPRVRAGVMQVQQWLVECGLWSADKIDGQYSAELRRVWDGALRFAYLAAGR